MIWNLVLKTIKARRGQWVAFCVLGFLFLILYLATFPAVQKSSADYDKIISTLPKGVLSVFNITESVPTLMGYLSSKHFGFLWALMIIILISSYSSFAIAKEVENRTLGFLLSRPISRLQFYLSRFLTGLVGLIIFIVFTELTTYPLAQIFGYSASFIEILNIAILGAFFGFAVLGLGLMFSALSSESSKSTGYLSTILLIMYVAYIIASLEPRLEFLQNLSIFYYFRPGDLVAGSGLSPSSLAILASTGLIGTLIGAFIFNKRDLDV